MKDTACHPKLILSLIRPMMFDSGQVNEFSVMCLYLPSLRLSWLNLNPNGRVAFGEITITSFFSDSTTAKSCMMLADTTGSGGNTEVIINIMF